MNPRGNQSKRHGHLREGETIPSIWARDIRGGVVDSNEFTSDYTLLVFLRFAGCPFCNLALYRLTREYKMLRKDGCEVVAFVQSPSEDIEKYIFNRHDMKPPFSIVADEDQDFYHLFGVSTNAKNLRNIINYTVKHRTHWLDSVRNKKFKQPSVKGNAFIVPAFFLVDKSGTVRMADYAANFYDDATFTSIYEHLTFGDFLHESEYNKN